MRFSLSAVIPDFLRYEFVALLVCWASGVGLFVYYWAVDGLAGAWPLLGVPLGGTLGLAFVVKLGRMIQRERTAWMHVNKTAFFLLFACVVAETVIFFLAPAFIYLVFPPALYCLWRLDKTKRPVPTGKLVSSIG